LALIVSSHDGNKLVAIGDTVVCVSTNAGVDWVTVGSPPRYSSQVAASADASTLALVATDASGYHIFSSTNSGATWEQRVPMVADRPWGNRPESIALSGDGSRLVAAAGFVFTSPLPPAALSLSVLNYPPSLMTWAISWPSNQIGFILESAPALSPDARWTEVTNVDPTLALITNIIYPGGYRHFVVVTNAVGAPSTFYRLHKP
jgi:hypothetical protein